MIAKQHIYSNKLVLFLVLLVYVLLALFYINSSHNWGGDFALYISQAQALITGQSTTLYEASKLGCEASYYRMNPDLYPPGFPILLTPAVALFGVNFWVFKCIIILCYLATLLVVYALFKRIASNTQAIVCTALMATSTVFIQYSNYVLADIPAMLWIMLGFYLHNKWADENCSNSYLKQIILATICVFAYQTKSLSIVLFLAITLHQLFIKFNQNRVKSIAVFIISFILLNAIVKLLYPHSGAGYQQQASTITWQTIQANLIYYSNAPKWFLYNSNLWLWLTWPMMIVGAVASFKIHRVYVFFMLMQLTALVIWPFQEGVRFIFILIPFYFLFAMLGYNYVASKFHIQRYALLVFLGVLMYSFYASVKLISQPLKTDDEITSADAQALFNFVNAHTKSTDKLIFFKPNVLRLLAQRESVYLLERNAIAMSKADWWIYKHGDMPADTMGLQPVFTNGTFTIFKLKME